MINENPTITKPIHPHTKITHSNHIPTLTSTNVFELIRSIKDPEYPQTLEELSVVSLENILIYDEENGTNEINKIGLPKTILKIRFRPTVPHCSMAGLIGLAIIYSIRFYDCVIRVEVIEDSHVNWKALNKQLNDWDRILAAIENEDILELIESLVPRLETLIED